VAAYEEVQRLNEGLENQVATRTRELRAAVEELKQAQTMLIETEKQVMLSRLTAGLLHEVNSPLGALRSATDTIHLSAEKILEALGRDPSHPATPTLVRSAQASASLAEVIVESTRRIEELMTTLRRFVSLDSSERKTVDVRSGVQAALVIVKPLLADRISVSQDWPARPLRVSCFPARLNQVFLNLLQNAAEALGDQDGGALSLTATDRGDHLTITLADNGPGMNERQLEGLFEFGFTEKEGGRVGLRLGLPSSKRWVEEIGGSIDVSSTVGAGTTVAIRLPLA
jgi:signal transduction histidine kinase